MEDLCISKDGEAIKDVLEGFYGARFGLSHNLGGVPYNGVAAITIVGRLGD